MSSAKKVLTFDIGIRNLAWCLLEKLETATVPATVSWKIYGWENFDLLAGTATQVAKDSQKILCNTCKKKASFQSGGVATCAVHCPSTRPPIRDLSGGLLKRLPPLTGMVELLSSAGSAVPKKKSKANVIEALGNKFSLPLVLQKIPKSDDTAALHDSIRTFVHSHKALFQEATHILLENQPAFKNPTMKTVQILLFASLREILLPSKPFVGFVHAGKKIQGMEKGDKGYLSRKKGSEDRVKEFFEKQTVVESVKWTQILRENQKKSDLCDALCMCLDKIEN